MTVAIGTRLGRYEIRSKLGEGGMGEVYLAQDMKLDRTVAVKVLPADLAQDQSRMRRFVQEARTASSLSHPNVAHIYEIEEIDGLNFIAMEYVNGATLRERIARGGLDLNEVLDIAVEIAAALSAAHNAGITHRDVKPDNVMLRQDGYVKVLDFGLAKLTELPTDTDTEALEWITTKALTKDPDERYQTAKEMMVDLRRIKQRLDAHAEIERSSAPDSSGVTSGMSGQQPSVGAASPGSTVSAAGSFSTAPVSSAEYLISEIKRHKTGFGLILAVTLVAAIGGGLWIYKLFTMGKSSGPPAIRFTRLTSGGTIGNETITGGAAISPDGKYVVFWTLDGTKSSCYVQQISTNSLVRIVGPLEGNYGASTFSPDGEFVFYNGDDKDNVDGALFQIPVLGGQPRKIVNGISSPVTFSPDARQIAYVHLIPATGETLLKVANADGSGVPKIIARRTLPNYFSPDGPSWSPDGRVIALGVASLSAGNAHSTVVEIPAPRGNGRPRPPPQWGFVSRVNWLSNGSGLVITLYASYTSMGTQIWFVSYTDGADHRITKDLNGYGTISLGVSSDSKTIVTVQEDFTRTIWITRPNDDPGPARQISNGKYEGAESMAMTRDGRIVYLDLIGDSSEIWIMKSDGSDKRRLTSDGALKDRVSVSPDDRYLLFSSNRSGNFSIWRADIDGNNPKQLTEESTFAVV